LFTGFESRHTGQHDVNNRNVARHASEHRNAHFATWGVVYFEAFALKHEAKCRTNVFVIFNNQNARHGLSLGIQQAYRGHAIAQ
jgi:hypothetical protein